MKRILLLLIIPLLLFFNAATQAAETYSFDPHHTYVLWRVNHFGFSNPSGKWYANGSLLLDEVKPQNSKLNVTIQIADIDTGIKELDDHLKSDLFFNVVKFPTSTFVSNRVELTGKNTAKIYGILTLHGVSKPIVFDAKLNKIGDNLITSKKTAGFSATTKLKRSDFGITTLLPGVGDEVTIIIEAEAYQGK